MTQPIEHALLNASRTGFSSRASFMQLAVVERQLIMQGLDFDSLCQIFRTCKQMRSESLHPASGRFLPPLKLDSHRLPLSTKNPGPDSALARVHIPMNARVDISAAASAADRASALDKLINTIASFRRVTSLSLWDCPPNLSEADALRLIAAVPLVETLWGVRTGTVLLRSLRVQEAIFRLPHLTRCAFGFTAAGGQLQPGLLALALQLRIVSLKVLASDLSPLLVVSAVRQLRQLWLTFSPSKSPARPVLAVKLPRVEQFGFEIKDESGRSAKPSLDQIETILRGMPALRELTVDKCDLAPNWLQLVQQLGPSCFPALEWIELPQSPHAQPERLLEFFVLFPAVELLLPSWFEMPAGSAAAAARLQMRYRTRQSDGGAFASVRSLSAQSALPN